MARKRVELAATVRIITFLRVTAMLRASAFVVIASPLALLAFAKREPVPVIGILEQPPQSCQKTRSAGVRPVFARRGASWVALLAQDSLHDLDLETRQFTLAFDGRSLGTLNTTDPGFQGDDWTFRVTHFLEVAPGQTLPQIANRAHRFEGWCVQPTVRPIVAVTSGHYEDPESWKPFQPKPELRDSLFAAFRAAVGKAHTCRHIVSAEGDSSEHDVLYRYAARDLVIEAAYRNAGGQEIVGLILRDGVRPCDYNGDAQVINHWFLMGRTPKVLGENMDLLDAGDYDGNGRAELIFWTGGEGFDAYVLMYDNFSKRTQFYWNYH